MTQAHLFAPPAPLDEGYQTILADSPWEEEGGGGRGAQNHGYYGRGQHELLLFGVRGRLPPLSVRSSVITGPKREHSRKPEESYALIEATSPGPRLEIFSRQPREGWDVWGNDPAVASTEVAS